MTPVVDTAAPVRPDLSSLPWETRVCVLLEEIGGGAVWKVASDGVYGLTSPRSLLGNVLVIAGRRWAAYRLRYPTRSSAAAWDLAVRERISIEEYDGRPGDVIAYFREDDGSPPLSDAKRAVVLAVLRKYATDPRWGDMVRPLLEEAGG